MKYDFNKVINRRGTNSNKWDMKGEDILPVWVADMDFKAPQPVIDALKERIEHGIFGYSHSSENYYQSIINWQKKRHYWNIEKDWILFSPGVVPGIHMLVNALTQPGDKVILQKPVYYPFFSAVKNNGCHILNNPLKHENGRYTMDFEDLEKKASDPRAKLLILCSPHNPVGRVWTKEELTKLGKICLKHNVTVISDEIHGDLVYKKYKHIPFASISKEFADNSVTCFAPSKTFNLAGLQTSCIIIPCPIKRKLYENVLTSNAIGNANVFGLIALEAAYTYGEEWLEQLLDYLQENINFMKEYIEENMPELNVIEPEGTYLVWIDCRKLGLTGKELEDLMLNKAKIWFDEGYIFGPEGEGFERINIACPRAILKEALERMKNAIEDYKSKC